MRKYKNIIILLNLIFVLAFFNLNAVKNEKIFSKGKRVYLELTRNNLNRLIIQGDIINLKYEVASGLLFDTLYRTGFVIVQLDSNSIAKRLRFQQYVMPLLSGEMAIAYTKNAHGIRVGAENLHIEEGSSAKYADAHFGGLQVDENGNCLLVGVYDSHLKKIE